MGWACVTLYISVVNVSIWYGGKFFMKCMFVIYTFLFWGFPWLLLFSSLIKLYEE